MFQRSRSKAALALQLPDPAHLPPPAPQVLPSPALPPYPSPTAQPGRGEREIPPLLKLEVAGVGQATAQLARPKGRREGGCCFALVIRREAGEGGLARGREAGKRGESPETR
ncbi:hypothetical protein PHLCEN_2v11060 [Hermanssonia centrifuga]|uniref:Uncharacterized protein n=1 Tax=Hermanssonia centrifuga TaxID=98765 RepID=A0A2R6NL15_9APHY|nr:hypothetical protein PHLCEN_2v11060 [Hermanssonia centrifuga]